MALTGHRDEVVVTSSEQESRVLDTKNQSQEAIKNDNAYTADNEPSKFSPKGCSSPADDPESIHVEEPRGKFRILAIMLALSLSLFIAALDQTIVATVIPTITADLHSAAGYVWIGGAFTIGYAAGVNLWINLSDIWGRKPMLLAAVAVFAVSSVVCATAIDMTMLIAGRAVSGVAGGGLIQLVTVTISDLFSVRRRSLYLGLIEFTWAVAGALGPVIGGALTQAVSWRWIYWINLPVCGTTFALLFFFLDVHNPRTRMMDGVKAIDWFGSVSIIGLVVMILLGLDFGGVVFAWNSPQVVCLIIFGCLMSMAFIYSEKRLAKYPLMPLSIFKNASNVAVFVVTFAHGTIFVGAEFYLPLYFQSTKQLSPLHSGLMILPIVLTESFVSVLAGLIIHRTGRYKEIIWTGTTLGLLGTGLYIALNTFTSVPKIVGYQIVAGLGNGLLFFPPLLALQNHVSQADTSAATATFGLIRNLATSISIVVGGVVFQNSMTLQQPMLMAAGLPAKLIADVAGANAAANVFLIGTIQDPMQQLVVKNAFAESLRNIWILYTCVGATGLVASFFITQRSLNKEHTETKTGIRRKEEQQHQLPSSGAPLATELMEIPVARANLSNIDARPTT